MSTIPTCAVKLYGLANQHRDAMKTKEGQITIWVRDTFPQIVDLVTNVAKNGEYFYKLETPFNMSDAIYQGKPVNSLFEHWFVNCKFEYQDNFILIKWDLHN